MRLVFVTLFPEALSPFIGSSIHARAASAGIVDYRSVNPRDFTYDRHRKVDDRPFGGGAGMLIKVEPVALAVDASGPFDEVIVTDPAAPLFTQRDANELAQANSIAILCGHYEGFDHRVRTHVATRAYSIGNFVLTNGELPALIMADAIVRRIEGVLGNADSLDADSFSDGLLSSPNYTSPVEWNGVEAPAVLRSGNHAAIAKWRREQAMAATKRDRPDLISDSDVP